MPADSAPCLERIVLVMQALSALAEVGQKKAAQERAEAARRKALHQEAARRKMLERQRAQRKAAEQQRAGLYR